MKNRTDKNKIVIYSISGLLVLSIAFCLFSLVYASIESVSASGLNEKFEEYKAEKQKAHDMEKTHDNWLNIEKIVTQFNQDYFFSMDEFGKFRRELQEILGKNRLSTRQEIGYYFRQTRFYIPVEIKFTAVGSYTDIKQFIYEINNMPKIILVKRLGFNRKSAQQISVQFTLEVYIVRKG